ncbi:MAG: carboxylesterase family protein [Lachnospiraceae bacterium]|nr:carboxylesterase family protein [Lachnospiraceae bacterium]
MVKNIEDSQRWPVVDTVAGKIRGYYFDETYIFQGIKYADAKRFQMPTPVAPWEGVKDAWGYGAASLTPLKDHAGEEITVPHRYWPQAEECQFLNVWTQDLNPEKKKPVLVWLHGGGFLFGSAVELACIECKDLCKYGDVVTVSLNHRLNILGYLDVSAYGDEKFANSGNVGMADIVAALEWIRDNIAKFGGDPDNVTIFGQSGGGGKVCALLQMPAADGLFHKAVVHSGIHKRRPRPDAAVSKEVVGRMLKDLNIPEDEFERLCDVPYDDLINSYLKNQKEMRAEGYDITGWAPLANGYYLGYAREDGFNPNAFNVPTIVFTCIAEHAYNPILPKKYELTEEETVAAIQDKFGEDAEKIIEDFKKAYPEKPILDVLAMDFSTRYGSLDHVAKRSLVKGAAPIYIGMLAQEFPVKGGKLAWHCADMPFFMHTAMQFPVNQFDGAEKLQEEMAGALVAFAKTGDPNHEGMEEWPAFDVETKPTIVFTTDGSRTRYAFDEEVLEDLKKFDRPFVYPD